MVHLIQRKRMNVQNQYDFNIRINKGVIMKKMLVKKTKRVWHFVDGIKIYGSHSGISGNLSNVSGNLSNVSGDLGDCEITQSDRDKGIDISELIKE
jgi:hypothetical protein